MSQVRMRSKTVFANERITVFKKGGPEEGIKGKTALVGEEFETDVLHARELAAAGLADPLRKTDLDGEPAPLEPHYQVSIPALAADQAKRVGILEAPAKATEETSRLPPAAVKAKPARA